MTPITISNIYTFIEDNITDGYVHTKVEVITINGESRPLGTPISWRGSYDKPSMDITEPYSVSDSDVAQLLDILDELTTEEFYGYKGGEYRFDVTDELWADSYGNADCKGFVDIKLEDGIVKLIVGQCEY